MRYYKIKERKLYNILNIKNMNDKTREPCKCQFPCTTSIIHEMF